MSLLLVVCVVVVVVVVMGGRLWWAWAELTHATPRSAMPSRGFG
jgi:hypothetical protein